VRAGNNTIEDILKDVQFPAKREQIIEKAKKQNAPDEVIKDLQNLPDQTYESADSLVNSLQKEVGGVTEGVSGLVGSVLGGGARETQGEPETKGSLLGANISLDVLKNVQFPARKEQIMESLRGQNASSDVMEELKRLPDKMYQSADAVMKELESTSRQAGRGEEGKGKSFEKTEAGELGGGGKSQGFGGTGTGGSGGGGPSTGGSSQSFGGRGGK
jgi:hypothetical protein